MASPVIETLQSRTDEFAHLFLGLKNPTAVTGAGADVEFMVSHNLGRVPNGFLVLNQDRAGSVYDSGTDWTDTAIYLKADVADMELVIAFL